jgi:glycosyltransferase involved in cell wall biosynthesis
VIAYLHQAQAYGAVESYLEQILAGLKEDAVVIAPRGTEVERLGAHARLIPFDPALGTLGRLRHLVRELRRVQPRLVHVVDVWPLAFIAARIARVPRVVVTHHTPELPRRDNAVGRLLWTVGWWTRPEVIFTSETDRARDGRRPSVVIPLGIDLDRFDVRRAPARIVGNVARLVRQKGQDTLLAAVPLVLERHPDVRFVIAGDGPLRDELARRAQGLPVELLGNRDDVPEQLARFDVFAFPSRFEGLCLAVIEAQAAGVPVVATPVGGIVETVVDGETGTIVPVDDPAALAAGISAMLDDPTRAGAMADAARRRVRELYSVEKMVERTLELYRRH